MTPKHLTTKNIIDLITKKLDAGKAEDIQVFDIRSVSTLTDYTIIATGTSSRHVMSLAHHLTEDLKENGIRPLNDFRQGEGHWVVVDLGAILVHILTQEARLMYALEEMWVKPKSKRTRKAPQKSA